MVFTWDKKVKGQTQNWKKLAELKKLLNLDKIYTRWIKEMQDNLFLVCDSVHLILQMLKRSSAVSDLFSFVF